MSYYYDEDADTGRAKIVLACHQLVNMQLALLLSAAGFLTVVFIFSLFLGKVPAMMSALDLALPVPIRLAIGAVYIAPILTVWLDHRNSAGWWLPLALAIGAVWGVA